MIVDMRIYTIQPGRLSQFLDLYRRVGLPLYTQTCGRLIGYYTSDSGTLNQVVSLWEYQDAADRDRRRATLLQNPKWVALVEDISPLIQYQESRILKPTDFSPVTNHRNTSSTAPID